MHRYYDPLETSSHQPDRVEPAREPGTPPASGPGPRPVLPAVFPTRTGWSRLRAAVRPGPGTLAVVRPDVG